MIDFKRSLNPSPAVRAAGIVIAAGLLLGACHYHVPLPGPRVVIGPGYHGHGHYRGHGAYHRRHGRYRRH